MPKPYATNQQFADFFAAAGIAVAQVAVVGNCRRFAILGTMQAVVAEGTVRL